jgi:hypothetical protein
LHLPRIGGITQSVQKSVVRRIGLIPLPALLFVAIGHMARGLKEPFSVAWPQPDEYSEASMNNPFHRDPHSNYCSSNHPNRWRTLREAQIDRKPV